MPKVFFMRHGKTVLNKENRFAGNIETDLTEEGAAETAANFQYTDDDFDVIYVSPLRRTHQTLDAAMPIHKGPIVDARIRERSLGEWEAQPYSNFSDEVIENYIKGFIDPPGSETFGQVRKRVVSFVEDLFNKYDEDTRILVVSHAGILRQVRDVFLPDMPKGKIKNSQILCVGNVDFDKYNKKKEKEDDFDM